ncbi:hypothetical protein BDZ89DRAFT_1144899 [Hymenopellis radicata]|nr:hypothetical protein BDZ89DRAFT_1144899 [Hymenopellis radicata]
MFWLRFGWTEHGAAAMHESAANMIAPASSALRDGAEGDGERLSRLVLEEVLLEEALVIREDVLREMVQGITCSGKYVEAWIESSCMRETALCDPEWRALQYTKEETLKLWYRMVGVSMHAFGTAWTTQVLKELYNEVARTLPVFDDKSNTDRMTQMDEDVEVLMQLRGTGGILDKEDIYWGLLISGVTQVATGMKHHLTYSCAKDIQDGTLVYVGSVLVDGGVGATAISQDQRRVKGYTYRALMEDRDWYWQYQLTLRMDRMYKVEICDYNGLARAKEARDELGCCANMKAADEEDACNTMGWTRHYEYRNGRKCVFLSYCDAMDAQPADGNDDGELVVSARPSIPQDIVDLFVGLALALPPGHLRSGSYYDDVWLDAKSFRKVHRSWKREPQKFFFHTIFVSRAADCERLYDGNWFIHRPTPWWKVKEMLECKDIRTSVRHFGFHGDNVLDLLREVQTRCPGVTEVTLRAIDLKQLGVLAIGSPCRKSVCRTGLGRLGIWTGSLLLKDGVTTPLEVECLSMEVRERDWSQAFAGVDPEGELRRPKLNLEGVKVVKARVVEVVADEHADNVMGRVAYVLMGVDGMKVFKLNLTNLFPQDWSRGPWGERVRLEHHIALTQVDIACQLWAANDLAGLLWALKDISGLEVVNLKVFVVEMALWDFHLHGGGFGPRRQETVIMGVKHLTGASRATVHLVWMGVFVGTNRHCARVRRESLRAILGRLTDKLLSPVPATLFIEFDEMDEELEMSWDGTGRRALAENAPECSDIHRTWWASKTKKREHHHEVERNKEAKLGVNIGPLFARVCGGDGKRVL